jgi:hypothetical protein
MLCDIVPCGKKAKIGPNGRPNGKGMCSMHYERNRRNGSPYAVTVHPVRCKEDGCEDDHYGNGWCHKHYVRMWRNGTMETKQKPIGHEDPSYDTMHKRVKLAYGPARIHTCVDCGGPATDWSYNHNGEIELVQLIKEKYLFRYGTSIDDYSPRCKSCHKIFDNNREDSHAEGFLPTAI